MFQSAFANIGRCVSFLFNTFVSILTAGGGGVGWFLGFFATFVAARFLLAPIMGFNTGGVSSSHETSRNNIQRGGKNKK